MACYELEPLIMTPLNPLGNLSDQLCVDRSWQEAP